MTKELAIEILKYNSNVIHKTIKGETDPNEVEALDMAIKALEQEPILDKIRTEIAEYGSIWVQYQITGRSDKDIQQLVTDVLKQAKEQVLDVIDKYKAETEE